MTATCLLFNLFFFLIVLLFLRVFRNIVGSLSGLTYWNNISRVCMCTNVMRLHTKHAIIEIIYQTSFLQFPLYLSNLSASTGNSFILISIIVMDDLDFIVARG